MSKNTNSLIIFFGVVILILAGAFYLAKVKDTSVAGGDSKTTNTKQEVQTSEQTWSVIYLTSGEIYVARLDYPVNLSEMRVSSDSYMMQIVKGKNEAGEDQSNFQLTPLNEFLWAPDDLYVNSDQVVFYGPVSEESGVGKAIKEAGKWSDEVTE